MVGGVGPWGALEGRGRNQGGLGGILIGLREHMSISLV